MDKELERLRPHEGGTFTPLVMSTSGGVGREFDKMIRKVAGRVVKKTEEQYSEIVSHLRTRLRFVLLRACLLAIRGDRRKIYAVPVVVNFEDEEFIV